MRGARKAKGEGRGSTKEGINEGRKEERDAGRRECLEKQRK